MKIGKAKPLPSVKSPKLGAGPVKKIKRPGLGMGTTPTTGMDDMARMMAAGGSL